MAMALRKFARQPAPVALSLALTVALTACASGPRESQVVYVDSPEAIASAPALTSPVAAPAAAAAGMSAEEALLRRVAARNPTTAEARAIVARRPGFAGITEEEKAVIAIVTARGVCGIPDDQPIDPDSPCLISP